MVQSEGVGTIATDLCSPEGCPWCWGGAPWDSTGQQRFLLLFLLHTHLALACAHCWNACSADPCCGLGRLVSACVVLCSAAAFSVISGSLGTTVLPHPYFKGQDLDWLCQPSPYLSPILAIVMSSWQLDTELFIPSGKLSSSWCQSVLREEGSLML